MAFSINGLKCLNNTGVSANPRASKSEQCPIHICTLSAAILKLPTAADEPITYLFKNTAKPSVCLTDQVTNSDA
ncbi:hypothetical protein IC582_005876 [Cucumis melo]